MLFSAIIPIEELIPEDENRLKLLWHEIDAGIAHEKFDLQVAKELIRWVNYYMGYDISPEIIVFENLSDLENELNTGIKKDAVLTTNLRNKSKYSNWGWNHFFTKNEWKKGGFCDFEDMEEVNFYQIYNDKTNMLTQPPIFDLLFQEHENLSSLTGSYPLKNSDDGRGDTFDRSFFGRIENFRRMIEGYEIESPFTDIVIRISDLYRKSYLHKIYYSPFLCLVCKYPIKGLQI